MSENSKEKKAKPPFEIGVYIGVVWSRLWTRSSMTEERLGGLAMMIIHRGTNYMPAPKDIYEGTQTEDIFIG